MPLDTLADLLQPNKHTDQYRAATMSSFGDKDGWGDWILESKRQFLEMKISESLGKLTLNDCDGHLTLLLQMVPHGSWSENGTPISLAVLVKIFSTYLVGWLEVILFLTMNYQMI